GSLVRSAVDPFLEAADPLEMFSPFLDLSDRARHGIGAEDLERSARGILSRRRERRLLSILVQPDKYARALHVACKIVEHITLPRVPDLHELRLTPQRPFPGGRGTLLSARVGIGDKAEAQRPFRRGLDPVKGYLPGFP